MDSQLFCDSVLSDSIPWLFHRDSLERRRTVVEGLRCTETRSEQEFLNEVLEMPTCLFQLNRQSFMTIISYCASILEVVGLFIL